MAAMSSPSGDQYSRDWLQNEVVQTFAQRFGYLARQIKSSPGRVNLIGEHVDYNQGIVLPMAVNRYTAVALSRRADSTLRVYSTVHDELATIDLAIPLPEPWPDRHWLGYVAGTIFILQESPTDPVGFDVVLGSTLPLGAGLSSSASLTTAIALAAKLELGLEIGWRELACVCQSVEHRFQGVPCGLMDQWACLLAKPDHLVMIDYLDETFRHIPWNNPDFIFLIINSGVKHQLVDGHYAERRQSCQLAASQLGVGSLRQLISPTIDGPKILSQSNLDPVVQRRARHVISEIQRTADAVAAIELQRWEELGRLMNASHQSLRDLFEVSCVEVDQLVAITQNQIGVLGSRMTGGGFGGSTISLVERQRVADIADTILDQYASATGIVATAFWTTPM